MLVAFTPYVLAKVSGNQFRIAGQPGGEVNWQVTGIRHDKYADAHRIPLEEAKKPEDRDYFLYPDAFGQPASRSLSARQHAAARGRHRRGPQSRWTKWARRWARRTLPGQLAARPFCRPPSATRSADLLHSQLRLSFSASNEPQLPARLLAAWRTLARFVVHLTALFFHENPFHILH